MDGALGCLGNDFIHLSGGPPADLSFPVASFHDYRYVFVTKW